MLTLGVLGKEKIAFISHIDTIADSGSHESDYAKLDSLTLWCACSCVWWFWLHVLVIDKLSADSPSWNLAVERPYFPGISDISDIKYVTYIRMNLLISFGQILYSLHSWAKCIPSHYGRSQPGSQAPLLESESLLNWGTGRRREGLKMNMIRILINRRGWC